METLQTLTTIGVFVLVFVAIALSCVGVVIGLKLKTILDGTQKSLDRTMTDVDKTLGEVNRVLVKVEGVADSSQKLIDDADKLMREEVTSTLHTTRAMLANVEITTRGIADTTTAVRRISAKADALVDTSKLIAAGSSIARFAAKQGLHAAGGLITGVGSAVIGRLTHRNGKHGPAANTNGAKRPEPKNEIITAEEAGVAVVGHRRRR